MKKSTSKRNHIKPQLPAFTLEPDHQPTVHTITIRDGRHIHITDHRETYRSIYQAGQVVFTSKEIELVKQSRASPELAARCFVDLKAVFLGAHIIRIDPLPVEAA